MRIRICDGRGGCQLFDERGRLLRSGVVTAKPAARVERLETHEAYLRRIFGRLVREPAPRMSTRALAPGREVA